MRKLTLEEVKRRVYSSGMKIEILSDEYISVHEKLRCRCLIDGYEWDAIASNLMRGHGCPRCGDRAVAEKRASSLDDVKTSLARISPTIKILSTEYENNRTRLECKCFVCGNRWRANANNLLMGKGCPKCKDRINGERQMMSGKEFEKRLSSINPEVKVKSEEYSGTFKKINVTCTICGHTWPAAPNNLLNGCGCPKCNRSKGEKQTEKWLSENQYDYRPQYRIGDCRFKKPLPFDFAVFSGDRLKCLIEYQGIQHYKIDSYYGGGKAFEYLKNNDKIKKQYCENNHIPLIEIPYTVKDIGGFLNEALNKL